MPRCPACHESYEAGISACPADGQPLLPDAAFDSGLLEPGTMVGEYRIDRKLGAGTFGTVYAGEQPLIGKRVAIKVLGRAFSAAPETVSRFVAEARAVNQIRHRNIIDIFSFGTLEDGRCYFVMELLDGGTLGELLGRDGRLSLEQALPILRGIAAALQASHDEGITHRDLKPDNVFLAREKDGSHFPKLLDFGLAKLRGEGAAHRTGSGISLGTPLYMSPEQCRGRQVDHRSDIYAFGVLTQRMLTGSHPFEAADAADAMIMHVTEPPRAPSIVCAEVPAAIDGPVLAMLAKAPNARPASITEAFAALEEAARSTGRSGDTGDLRPAAGVPAETTLVDGAPVDGALVDGDRAEARPPVPSSAKTLQTAAVSGPAASARSSSGVRAALKDRLPIPMGLFLVVAIGVLLLVGTQSPDAGPRASSLAAARPDSAAARAPSGGATHDAPVKLRILSSPPDGEVWLGDSQLGATGEVISLPRGDRALTIEVRKQGYRTKRFEMVPDEDLKKSVDLEPLAPGAPAGSTR